VGGIGLLFSQEAHMALRKNKVRIFGGKKYERVGQFPSKVRRVLEDWAGFQRRVNNRNVRIVREAGGWEAYISVARRK
jgi:hypothetical protein